MLVVGGLAAVLLAVTATGALAAGTTPPFTQCPNVYLDTGCQYLIDVTGGASAAPQTTVYVDPNQPLIDGTEDTLVGVQNDSSTSLSTLYIGVDGTADDDFGFDGDGLCNASPPVPAGCPFGPTGYEGQVGTTPGQSETFTTTDATTDDNGYITFNPSIPAGGGVAYFSLEGNPNTPVVAGTMAQNVSVTTVLTDTANGNTSTSCTTGLGCGELAAPTPVNVTDQATLTGPNVGSEGGTVTYEVYTDAACQTPALNANKAPYSQTVNVSNGAVPASTAAGIPTVNLPTNHTYYWRATYSGDPKTTNTASASPCGAEVMVFGTSTIAPSVSGGGASGTAITVPYGTAVTATATVGNAKAGGTVYYDFFADSACTAPAATGGHAAVTNGTAGASSPVTFPLPGTYYLQVSYSGDANDAAATSCTANVTVSPPTTTTSSVTQSSSTTSTTTTTTATTATHGVLGTNTTTPLPPPTIYKTVNVYPVSGKVYIELPPGATLSRANTRLARASAAKGIGFIPLTQARQIPVGSVLDTTGGTVAITAASPTKGKLYTGNFTAGIFQLLQSRTEKGLAQLNLRDTVNRHRACTTVGKGARASAAKKVSNKVLGLLKSTDNGKFSTRGDYSAATVRGTAYSVENTCAGTLTKVTRGSVVVDYFRRHKMLVVKAGHQFLAKASGGPSVVVTIGKKASAAVATELSAVL